MLHRYLNFLIIGFFVICINSSTRAKVLIIEDELPQMEVLAEYLKANGNIESEIVNQENLPNDFSLYQAVIVYIHGKMFEPTEVAIIDYTKKGGRLVILHHSISSGKAKNKYYFDFMGIQLDEPTKSKYPVEPGAGYGWVDPITMTMVNLNPKHYITNHNIDWNETADYISSDWPGIKKTYPAIVLHHTEAYMNHKYTDGREKTVLVGMKFLDERNGKLFQQDRAVWVKQSGKGHIVYFMPGHSELDYQNKNISQWVLNAVVWEN